MIIDGTPLDVILYVPRAKPVVFDLVFQTATGAAIDITGDTIEVRMLTKADGALVATFGTGGVKTLTAHSSPTTGTTQLAFTAAELTDGAPNKVGKRWVQIDRLVGGSSGQRVPWWHGPLEIHPA